MQTRNLKRGVWEAQISPVIRHEPGSTNIADWKMGALNESMYVYIYIFNFLLKMVIFQPAMLVY